MSQPPIPFPTTSPAWLLIPLPNINLHADEQPGEGVSPCHQRLKQRGSAQGLWAAAPAAAKGASTYLLLQLCLQLADELIFALHGFQQLLVLPVQAAC